jgi:CRP-like cAMP-binding protein
VDEGKTILMVTHDDDQAKRVDRTVIIADGEIVNEYLAQALPGLSQELLVKITKQAATETYGPGEPIIWQDAEPDNFYIVQKGDVHVYLRHPDGHETFVDSLGPGEYFGEMALLRGTRRTAMVRAARHNEAEVIALDKEEFQELIDDSESTLALLEQEATRRSKTQSQATEEEGQ